ncbi:MAG: competence protein ComEC, partial [Sphingopyxis granuli]
MRRAFAWLEDRLDRERERLGLWLPVALSAGIGLWLAAPARAQWIGTLFLLGGGVCGGLLIGWQRRTGRSLAIACATMAAGLLLIWARAAWVAAPV